MPDDTHGPSDRRTEPASIDLGRKFWEDAFRSGVARESLPPEPVEYEPSPSFSVRAAPPDPVEYEPYIVYRGQVLWHNQSDAMDAANDAARMRATRHRVRPKRVHGHDHLLWLVIYPATPKAAP